MFVKLMRFFSIKWKKSVMKILKCCFSFCLFAELEWHSRICAKINYIMLFNRTRNNKKIFSSSKTSRQNYIFFFDVLTQISTIIHRGNFRFHLLIQMFVILRIDNHCMQLQISNIVAGILTRI